ncbi:MAG: hypothetical protein HUJ56_09035, partial [Erysipelotrichaceae bacterium]|nr:hypothetical protein [Erysipelotrichaceae bacterium]
ASYRFLDEAFNGEKSLWSTPVSCESKSRIASFSPAASYSLLGSKVIEAYSYFNASNGSSNACSYQRDYIYYGMTPSSSTGILNPDIFEYMTFIEIDPDAYLLMTDKNDPETDDPQLLSSTKDRCDFTKAELLNKVWTKGSYNIRVEMVLSKSTEPDVKYIGLKSEDIWDFSDSYYRSDYVHPTLFRHSKYTYTVDPAKFIKKRYYLPEKEFQFDRWNLAEEGLSRRIRFYEVDPGVLVTKKYTYDVTRVTSAKVNGNVKFGLGEKSTYNAGVERESSSSTTITETKEVTTSFTDEDDDLGIATINFYDPIIEGMSGSDYVVKTYSTGHARVTFGITAR